MSSLAAGARPPGFWRRARLGRASPQALHRPAAAASDHNGDGDGDDSDGLAASGSGGAAAANLSATGKPLAPWTMTFDLKERDTLWTEENQARLVRIVAGYQLDLDVEEVEARMADLAVLLPQLSARCAHIKPSTLAALLREPAGTLVPRLVALVDLLPGCDVGWLAAAEPELLLLRPLDAIRADVARLGELLGPGVWWASGVLDVGALVQQQPRFLDAELVSEVLEELRRLMPGRDAEATLLSDPSWLLRVERGRGRLGDDPD